MSQKVLQTVIETPEFLKKATAVTTRDHIDAFVNYVAAHPLAGELIQGTGGARKMRWKTSSDKGKSGGMRIIYYYRNQAMPIYLFTAYAKKQRANISAQDKQALKNIIGSIVEIHEGDRNG